MSTKTHKFGKAKSILSVFLTFAMLNSFVLTAFASGDVLLIAPNPAATEETTENSGKSGRPLNEKYTSDYGTVIEGDYLDLDTISKYSAKLAEYKTLPNATEDINVKLTSATTEYSYIECPACGHKFGAGGLRKNAMGFYECEQCGGSCTEDNVHVKKQNVKLGEYEGKEAFLWTSDYDYIEFEVYAKQSGVYQMELDYYLASGNSSNGQRELYIDGTYPYVEAGDLVFYRYFKDEGEPVINSLGDETRPSQEVIPGWRTQKFVDSAGLAAEPLRVYLEQGKHTVKLVYNKTDMAIAGIRFVVPVDTRSYANVYAEYMANGYKEVTSATADPSVKTLEFQAETETIEKNDPTLRRETNTNPTVRPRALACRLLNIMGGSRWKYGNQAITWKFSVAESGLYKIGVRYNQSWNDGLPAFRQIAIDGVVPFEELLEYEFPFTGNSWSLEVLSDDEGTPYVVYLEAGEHTMTMSVKFGHLTEIIESLEKDIATLSDMVLNITLVAGSDPDPNYDYRFFKSIPNLENQFKELVASMEWKYNYLKETSDKIPAMANQFLSIRDQLNELLEDPFLIAKRFADLNTAQTNLSTYFQTLQQGMMCVDYFYVGPASEKWENEKSNIFQSMYTMWCDFKSSFTKDYDNVGGVMDEDVVITETLNVWVARGTEWAELIKELADESFTPYTGISVDINIVPAGQLSAGNVNALMLAVTSGKAPDVAMGVDISSPGEFAIRDAVYDLSQFESRTIESPSGLGKYEVKGFDEIKSRFVEEIFDVYTYNGGIYALPETMEVNVLFYRKDVLSSLGINVPDTRQELYDYVMPVLYQNGLEFYFARDFTQILFQNGGSYYTEDGMKSAFDTAEAYEAFKEYTELFTHLDVEETANFYNRFRDGVMPIGVGTFATYLQLCVAAPELAGKWGIALLPGVEKTGVDENGNEYTYVDRTAGALAQTCDIIMKQSTKPEASWAFIEWWTSAEVQALYASEVEALQGASARWNTANKEAFLGLDWDKDDIEVIEQSWEWAQEVPFVLGGQYVARHLTNAWTSVVVSGGDVREALEEAVKQINRELRMKQEEYGFSVPEE